MLRRAGMSRPKASRRRRGRLLMAGRGGGTMVAGAITPCAERQSYFSSREPAMELDDVASPMWPRRFSLHTLLGVHSAAAAMCKFASEAPLIAAFLGACAGLMLLQLGVLAVCTRVVRGAA